MRVPTALAALLLAGCTPCPPATPGPQPEAATRTTGIVRVAGSAPVNTRVVVQAPGGEGVYVTGPLAEEIRRLSGAEVEVWGRPGERGALQVEGYAVRSVDGAPVVTGVVERAPDGGLVLRTAGGETVRLSGATSQLTPGQKVWVQGATTVQVHTYGVIAP